MQTWWCFVCNKKCECLAAVAVMCAKGHRMKTFTNQRDLDFARASEGRKT